jgi:hypothetical protein
MDGEKRRMSILEIVKNDLCNALQKEYKQPQRGNTIRLSLWVRLLFAVISRDWNPIHFKRRAARAAGLKNTIVHGAMLYCILPRLLESHFKRLQVICLGHGVIERSCEIDFCGTCDTSAYIFARVCAKNIRAVTGGILLQLAFEIVAFHSCEEESSVLKGKRTLFITDPT